MAFEIPSDEPWRLVLEKAKMLTGFSEEDERVLSEASESLLPFADEIAVAFYDTLFGFETTHKVFRDLDQDRKVREGTLRLWFRSLVSGQYDDKFWTWHWLVGLIHIQHHVEHVFVMSMFGRLQTILVEKAMETFEEASAERVIKSLLRVTTCLSALAIEAYHQEYLAVVKESGMKESVLNRMVSIEVKKKIKEYRNLLGAYPVH